MICPHCREHSSDSEWRLDDGAGEVIPLGDLEESSDWDQYEAATCPSCFAASYIDELAEFNA